MAWVTCNGSDLHSIVIDTRRISVLPASRCCARAFVLVVFLLNTGPTSAQVATDHASHHPPAATSQGTAMTAEAAPAGQPSDCMMGCMGIPTKALYPSLIEMPELPAVRRTELLAEQRKQMVESARRLSRDVDGLLPQDRHDHQTMLDAATQLRRALTEYSAAVANHAALSGGTPPYDIALTWFRREMSLGAAASGPTAPSASAPRLGTSHLLAMLFLVASSTTALVLHIARRRRTVAILAHLRADGPAGPAVSSAAAAATEPSAGTLRAPASVTGNWSGQLRVARTFAEAPGVKTFRLAPVRGAELPFMFEPGQFLTVTVRAGTARVARSYSIASSPCCHGWCDITVKHVPGGVVSGHLHERVDVGALLDVSGPYGRFTFSGDESSQVVFIAGGIGITPLMSAIRYLTDQSWAGEIYLLYGATRLDSVIFRDELDLLAKRHPNLHMTLVLSNEPAAGWPGARGHIDADTIARSVSQVASARIHVCGPPAMMDAVQAELAKLGVPAHAIHTELFLGTSEVEKPTAAEVAAATGAACHFARSGKAGSLAGGMTILEAAESVGVPIQYACRQGYCGLCKVKLLEGEVSMAVEDGLTPGDKAAGLVLSCQARSSTDITVDA